MSLIEEIRKIPPVTRFLCGSSLVVTLSVMMKIVSPYKVVFVRELVTHGFEVRIRIFCCTFSYNVGAPISRSGDRSPASS